MNELQVKAKEDALNSFFEEVMKPYFLEEYEGISKEDMEPEGTGPITPDSEDYVAEMPSSDEAEAKEQEVIEMPEPEYKPEPKKTKGPSISIIDIAMAKPKTSKSEPQKKATKKKSRSRRKK